MNIFIHSKNIFNIILNVSDTNLYTVNYPSILIGTSLDLTY